MSAGAPGDGAEEDVSEALCEVWFYHLELSRLEQVLPELLEKTLARGWRAVVRTGAAERLGALDDWLWTWKEGGFLPHGRANEVLAERQPVLLTVESGNPNNAQVLFLVDGADAEDLAGWLRCIVIFDGADEVSLAAARRQWTSRKASGHAVAYWRQAERGWRQEA